MCVVLELQERAQTILIDLWNDLSTGGHGLSRMNYAKGYIDALKDVGLISREEQDGWTQAIGECPGHTNCQVWCSYCGRIEQENQANEGHD